MVSAATVDGTSKVLSLTVPGTATAETDTATITVTASDESGKSVSQSFVATAVGRPAFASETPTATLAENADGSSTAVEITELTVSGGMGAKSYTLVSVNGQTSGDDYDNFAVATKTGSEATTGVVTYSGSGEDYEALKAALSSGEPTFALVIGVTDARGLRSSADSTLTVTVTDANDAPTFASQDPASPSLLEKLGGDNADNTANTNDDPRLLATLTFADVDATDTSLAYSVVSVAPSSLGAGNFSVAAKSGSALEAELSFVGAATVVDYSSVQSFTVTVRAADGSAQVDQAVLVTVQENTAPTVSVAATGTPTLQPNTPLTLKATVTDANIAAGDVLSYAWTVASASAGGATSDITLAPTDAASTSLTVPNVAVGATYGIQVLVTDLASQTATASYSLVVASDVAPAFGATVDAQSFAAQYGIEALQLPAATGGTGTVAYSLTGAVASSSTGMLTNNLPAGLAFDNTASSSTFLQLSGEPTAAAVGLYDMTYRATDTATPPNVATLAFQLTVTANQAPVFSDAAKALVAANYNYLTGTAISALVLPEAEGGEGALSYSLTATAGTAANISNNLPAGLSFNSGSRTLSGTPTAADSYSLTYAVDDTDSNSASSDTATIAFTAVVEADVAPTLTPSTAVTASGNKDRVLTAIALPQAGAGNFGLSDSLEGGTYTPEGASPTTTTIGVESDGTILTDGTDDTTDSGLVFAGRTGAGAGAVATITGTPSVTGTFSLTYRVSDGDSNTSASTDEATVAVTLTVTDPALTLAGGVADGAGILLKREASTALTTAISLPRVSTPVGAVTYALKATQTHDSSGAINSPSEATVATTAAAAPAGLTYTADNGSAAGKLAGTPSTVGIWTLIYEAMDAGGAGSGDDKTDSIGFTLSVVADSALTLSDPDSVIGTEFSRVVGMSLGTDSDTAFELPAIAGGHGVVTESLMTTCALSGGSCAADAVTTIGTNTVPKGLKFTASSGATPAGLTGTFGSEGLYSLVYSATDTAIANTAAYQTADTADSTEGSFDIAVSSASMAELSKGIDDISSLARSTAGTPSTTTINLYEHFSPSSGLSFTATSSNEKVLTVAETGGVLTLTATLAGGTSTVTVSAAPVTTSFEVTVTPTNTPVFSAGNLETLSKNLTVGAAVRVAPGAYFSDADSDALTYKLLDSSAAEQDSITYRQSIGGTATDVLTATISGTTLTLTGVAKTSSDLTLMVRATDTGGNSVTGSFAASVTNRAPTAVSSIAGQTAVIGETTALSALTLGDYFSDAETSDANLVVSASSSDTAVVTTAIDASGVLSLTVPSGVAEGATATITLTATDESGQSVTQTFVATAAIRPAFAAATYSADLAENAAGDSTAVALTELTVTGSTATKSYTVVSVNGQSSGTDFGKFAVAAKTGSEATTAEVTYIGTGEDYETLDEPTFELVIAVADATNLLAASANTTLTVTVTDVNEAPTATAASDATADTPDPGATVRLLGTGSDQDVGDSLTYSWTLTGATAISGGSAAVADIDLDPVTSGVQATLAAQNATIVVPVKPAGTSYSFSLQVSDDATPALTATATLTLTVAEAAARFVRVNDDSSRTPLGSALALTAPNQSVTGHVLATIQAEDPNGGALTYALNGTNAAAFAFQSDDSTPATYGQLSVVSTAGLAAGDYAATLTATKTEADGSTTSDTALAITLKVAASGALTLVGTGIGDQSITRAGNPPSALPLAVADIGQYFTPATGLTFETPTSSNELVATVALVDSVSGDADTAVDDLVITPTGQGGTTTITYGADNAATSAVTASFVVAVTPSSAPMFSAGDLETLSKGLTVAVDVEVALGDYFSDSDITDHGDALSYKLLDSSAAEQDSITYQQSSTDVLTATISGATLTLTGVAKTSADVAISVRATDSGGNRVDASFAATVTNTVPTAVSSIAGQTAVIGETRALGALTLGDYFADAETSDANLSFSASSSDTAVVSVVAIDASDVLSLTVPSGVADGATATITLTASDESGQSVDQTFTATAASRPAFAAATYSADLAENAAGDSTAVALTELTVEDGTGDKAYTVVSVNGQSSGTDFGKFAVAAKSGATATTAAVTYIGTGEDYEALKAASTPDEPTFALVIAVTDANSLAATDPTTLTVTVTDVNEAPTATAASDATADTAAPGTTVQLLGTGSDPDAGDSLTYSWTLTGANAADIDLDPVTSGVQATLAAQNATITVPASPPAPATASACKSATTPRRH